MEIYPWVESHKLIENNLIKFSTNSLEKFLYCTKAADEVL